MHGVLRPHSLFHLISGILSCLALGIDRLQMFNIVIIEGGYLIGYVDFA